MHPSNLKLLKYVYTASKSPLSITSLQITARLCSAASIHPRAVTSLPRSLSNRRTHQLSKDQKFSTKSAADMTMRTLGAKQAAALDEELLSTGGFSIDQLMEMAGLSVSQAVYKMLPPTRGKRILVACGPGNNGGDGLVAARHLHHYGYTPTIYYPKQSGSDLFKRLVTQLQNLSIPFNTSFPTALDTSDLVVDAIFGFSFTGPVRGPFPEAIAALASTKVPVLAVDAPSSWNIETGPPGEGPGRGYVPDALISLTAPKPLIGWFRGRHFVGGRFLSKEMADEYDIDVPDYLGIDQIVEVSVGGEKV